MRRRCCITCDPLALLAAVFLGFCQARAGERTSGFGSGVPTGQIQESNLAELSGIVASRNNPGVLWVHNDRARGDVYAVSTNGQLLATWSLSAEVSDFEDIAMGPGPIPELQYLYCGDIGDNAAVRPDVRVYRAGEPAAYLYQASHPRSQNFPMVEKFTFEYPDGSHNAEALLVDPWTGDVLIATKEPEISRVYVARSAQLQDGATIALTLLTAVEFDIASAGDISPDGAEIILRQENFAKTWTRQAGQSIAEALATAPSDAPVIGEPTEPNGEGVGYAADGQGYYTVSEGTNPVLYYFPRLAAPVTAEAQSLVPAASRWRFKDNGSDQGTAWRAADFDESRWATGAGQFGYGEDDEQTRISYGSDKDHKHVTTYVRTHFQVPDPALFDSLQTKVLFDDGIAIYLNGTEVLRRNLPAGASFSDTALVTGGSYENLWQTFTLPNLLRAGTNTIAVEVHRHSRSEADLSFDLQLLGLPKPAAVEFTSPPARALGSSWMLPFRAPGAGSVTLESSADLVHWSVLSTVSPASGAGSFTLPWSAAPVSFYRLRR